LDEGVRTRKVEGESAIPTARLPIERVYLQPDDPPAFPPALQAILNADIIVAGPGSLFTSIIPNLLVADIVKAIRTSAALKIYICNVATQPGETDGYSVADHLAAIEAHTQVIDNRLPDTDTDGGPSVQLPVKAYLFDHVLANNNQAHPIPAAMNLQPVSLSGSAEHSYTIIAADVVDELHPWRHDSVKLARELMTWYKGASSR
jgi:uncharacterized cofD-like protein